MEYLGILIGIVLIIFIIWLLPKAFKSWKVSWVGIIITGFLAFALHGGKDAENAVAYLSHMIGMWVLYYLLAVIIFKTVKEVRDFFKNK